MNKDNIYHVYSIVCICTIECQSVTGNNEILPFGAAWKDWAAIMLMKCQTEMREIWFHLSMEFFENMAKEQAWPNSNRFKETENWLMVVRGKVCGGVSDINEEY